MATLLTHATCVALGNDPDPVGVLLRGPSGAGKSDLALRLIDRGARLVADDQTELRAVDGALRARAPAAIAGKMEVRGLGIAEVAGVAEVAVRLVVDLVEAEKVERMPETSSCVLLDIEVPRMALDPFEASAPAKLRLAAMRARAPGDRSGDRPGDQSDAAEAPEPAARAHGAESPSGRRRVVLVTGLSGAGRTSALNALEDLGYEAIDNLPLDLLDRIVRGADSRPVAVGVDIRSRNFAVEPLLEHVDRQMADPALDVTMLFVDCDDEGLRRRYTETRRPHPLASERPVVDGIAAERRLVAPLRARADLVVDTSSLTPGEYRRVLAGHFGLEGGRAMTVFVTSFSFRNGLPREADLVFDVRFLDNPHYRDELRPLTGRDPRVVDFVGADPDFAPFFDGLTTMLGPLLPRFEREGKSYLTIAFGCTGGRHRSVMIAERLAAWLRDSGRRVMLVHREIGRAER